MCVSELAGEGLHFDSGPVKVCGSQVAAWCEVETVCADLSERDGAGDIEVDVFVVPVCPKLLKVPEKVVR